MPAVGPDKQLCGAQRPNQPPGVTCKRVAGHGTSHLGTGRCHRHGGATHTHVVNAREHQAREACQRLGVRIELDPGHALMQCVWDAAGMAEWYRARVDELAAHPGEGPPAVYGPTYHANGQQTGRALPHILVTLHAQERDRLKDASVAALHAGVEQRILDLATDTARRLADGFRAFALAIGQDPASVEVRAAMRTALAAACSGTVDSTAQEVPAP